MAALTERLRGQRRGGQSRDAAVAALPGRLQALAEAVDLADGRLDADLVGEARAVVGRAGERLQLSAEHTVVALAGATGSGKSSLFNALAGIDLSRVGVRRPTTSTATACIWGPAGAGPLLEWLGIPTRHQVARESVLDADSQADLNGLVLLDLPDHDSTEVAHRLEVDRLVGLVDVLVWVLDPQKYADAAVHEQYLRRLAGHSTVTVVVLNQVDRLPPEAAAACLGDLRRLLTEDGLVDVPVLATSARTGAGLAELRALLVSRVAAREDASRRLAADVDGVVSRMAQACGTEESPGLAPAVRAHLIDAMAQAAGVPAVARAVDRSYRYQAGLATGWPVTRWTRRLRADPLRALHLDRRVLSSATQSGEPVAAGASRTSLPTATPVARSRLDTALRQVVDESGDPLPPVWRSAVGQAARSDRDGLADALDGAVARADLGSTRVPRWWRAVGGLQWLLAAVLLAGLLWLFVLGVFAWLQLPAPPTPRLHSFAVPTLLVVGGALLSIVLAALARAVAAVGARRRAVRAEAAMHREVEDVAQRLVVDPVEAELARHRALRAALRSAGAR